MSSIVEVQTLNGTEFVNLNAVRRFVLATDDSLELRFGSAETLVLTGANAQRVLQWVKTQTQTDAHPVPTALKTVQTPATDVPAPVTPKATPGQTKAKTRRVIELIPLKPNLYSNPAGNPLTDAPTLNSLATSAKPTRCPSPTINHQQWLLRQE